MLGQDSEGLEETFTIIAWAYWRPYSAVWARPTWWRVHVRACACGRGG